MNKKTEAFLKSFSKMDLDMLELILDDSKTYEDVRKDVFLRKIEGLFGQFRKYKDTALTAHKGRCASDDCPNTGCTGYAFVGNNSNNYANFIVTEIKVDVDDIYTCSTFKVDENNVELKAELSYYIHDDEKAAFTPDTEYLIKVQLCEKAYTELVKNKFTCIDKEEYTYWLKKHEVLFNSFEYPPLEKYRMKKFYILYQDLKDIADCLKQNNKAEKAMRELKMIDTSDENTLIDWLLKYEPLHNKLLNLPLKNFWDENAQKTGYAAVSSEFHGVYDPGYHEIVDNFNIGIATNDFGPVIYFKQFFDEHYWPMLTFYNEYDRTEIEDDREVTIYKSTYKLLKREKLKIGQEICAVRNHSENIFKKGDRFIIRNLKPPPCSCFSVMIDIGYTTELKRMYCSSCNNSYEATDGIYWFANPNFAPVFILKSGNEILY